MFQFLLLFLFVAGGASELCNLCFKYYFFLEYFFPLLQIPFGYRQDIQFLWDLVGRSVSQSVGRVPVRGEGPLLYIMISIYYYYYFLFLLMTSFNFFFLTPSLRATSIVFSSFLHLSQRSHHHTEHHSLTRKPVNDDNCAILLIYQDPPLKYYCIIPAHFLLRLALLSLPASSYASKKAHPFPFIHSFIPCVFFLTLLFLLPAVLQLLDSSCPVLSSSVHLSLA